MGITQIILLNWNGAADTIACLQSVVHMRNTRIAVWDNCSSDDSVNEIEAYLQSEKIAYQILSAVDVNKIYAKDVKISLVLSGDNIGFAAPHNRIVEQAMKDDAVTDVWLLNNDALADEHALDELRKRLYEKEKYGFAGSVIMDFEDRDIIQCSGVIYHKFFGVAKLQFKNQRLSTLDRNVIATHVSDFQHGASLLVKKEMIKHVGMMDEAFFLYAEEHDWQERAKKKGYWQMPAAESLVYHKGSTSTSGKKHLFYYYYNKSSVIFSRKHHSFFTAAIASVMLTGITMVRSKMNAKCLDWGIKGIREGWFKK